MYCCLSGRDVVSHTVYLKPVNETLASEEVNQVHIAACLAVMQCLTQYIIDQVKETLASEEVNQVCIAAFLALIQCPTQYIVNQVNETRPLKKSTRYLLLST